MVRFDDRNDWIDLWNEYKQGMLRIMISNMCTDIESGYDYFGKSITAQREKIEAYKSLYDYQRSILRIVSINAANRRCYEDLKMYGVI